MVDFLVKCKQHKAEGKKWVLESGKTYIARVYDNETVGVAGEGTEVILTLTEFHFYCVPIKKLS